MSIGTAVNPESVSTDGAPGPATDDAGPAAGPADRGADGPAGPAATQAPPELLRVVKGAPSSAELAALAAVVAAAASNGGGSPDRGPLDRWGDRAETVDGPPRVLSPRAYQSGRFGGR